MRRTILRCFEQGNGRPKDVARSRVQYAQAADLGWVQAKCALGNLLIGGQGGAVEAERWWRVAHEGGRTDAAGLIAMAVVDRLITIREGKKTIDRAILPEAVKWLEIAAARGPDPAQRKKFAEQLKILTGGK